MQKITCKITALAMALIAFVLAPTAARAQEAYAVMDEEGVLTFYYDDQRTERLGDAYDVPYDGGELPWLSFDSDIVLVVFNESFKDFYPTTTASWFYSCSNIEEFVGMQYLSTADVTDMTEMFANCYSLTSLDLSDFDTSSVTKMDRMFQFCENLQTIYCSDTWSCASSSEMLDGCTALEGAVPYDESLTDVSMANPDTGYFTTMPVVTVPEPYAVSYEGTLTFYYDDQRAKRYGTSYDIPTDDSRPKWYYSEVKDTKYVFDESFKDYTPIYINKWFRGNAVLETIEGLEYLNTSSVTDMYGLFSECSSLTALDLNGLDTSNVTNMGDMFFGCSSLTSLDLSGLDTSNVTGMMTMFRKCSALTSLDLSGFDTSKVTNTIGMFHGCSALTSLDLSGFDTSNVTDMSNMFCDCNALTSLDLSGFDTSNVTDMSYMFSDCDALTTIYCADTWTCDSSEDMFYECTDLVGAVPYDYSKVDVSMANPITGYFTRPGASVTDINADESLAPTEIYNLQGIRMLKPLSDLPTGIYIAGGRKVLSRR